MIRYNDATNPAHRQFHEHGCQHVTTATGRQESRRIVWQRAGPTQTDPARPNWFRIPIRYGLRSGSITPDNQHAFHTADRCPIRG